jgi:hypothetical protein
MEASNLRPIMPPQQRSPPPLWVAPWGPPAVWDRTQAPGYMLRFPRIRFRSLDQARTPPTPATWSLAQANGVDTFFASRDAHHSHGQTSAWIRGR